METTYSEYCTALDGCLNESIITTLSGRLKRIVKEIHKLYNIISEDVDITIIEIVEALKVRSVFLLLKSFGFALKRIIKAIHLATNLINKGVLSIFEELEELGQIEKLQSNARAFDEFLKTHPILKGLTGLAVSGLLIMTWLNMTFIGNFKYDFDVSGWVDAAMGNFSIHETFFTPRGLTMIAFLATGVASGGVLSVAWFGSASLNMLVALTYVGIIKVSHNEPLKKYLKRRLSSNKNIRESKLLTFKEYQDHGYIFTA